MTMQPGDPFGVPSDINDTFSVDLSNTQEGGDVPEGTYIGRCRDVKSDTSKAGLPMWVWTFEIIQGPQTGRELMQWTSLSEKALWKVAQTVAALGLGKAGEKLSFSKAQALGRVCVLVVTKYTRDGKERTSLDEVQRLPEAATQNSVLPPHAGTSAVPNLPTAPQAQAAPAASPQPAGALP